jgi:hypothetical protein
MRSNSGPAKRLGQGAAAPRRRSWPEARSSTCDAPQGSSESSWVLARRTAPYRPGARRGPSTAPRRTRAGQGSHATAASPSSPRRHRGGLTYKNQAPRPNPRATPSRRPPLPPSRWTRLLARIPGRLTILTYSLGALEACAIAYFPGIARRHRSHRTLLPTPPATAVRRRRLPLRPNSEHPRALGEITILAAPL